MLEIILTAFSLGITSGAACAGSCAPLYIPYLISEERNGRKNLKELFILLSGRLAGYLIFGLAAAFLGIKLRTAFTLRAGYLVMAALSLLMILYGLQFFKFKLCPLRIGKGYSNLPFFIGLASGISVCPPFLIALNYVFLYESFSGSVVFFLVFFIATSLYIFPVVLLGSLSKSEHFRLYARAAMVATGAIFLASSIYNFFN